MEDGFSASSRTPTRVAQVIPENISLTFGVESRGKSMSMPLSTEQRSEGGNNIFRVSMYKLEAVSTWES